MKVCSIIQILTLVLYFGHISSLTYISNANEKNVLISETRFNLSTPIHNGIRGNKTHGFCGTLDDEDQYVGNDNSRKRVKRYRLVGSKWEKLEITWAVTVNSTKSTLPYVDMMHELTKAFDLWGSKTKMKFYRVSPDSKDIDIEIGFYRGQHIDRFPFDGPGNKLAHAFYPSSGGDIHFDDDEEFFTHQKSHDDSTTSFLVTAAHELGHSLGLHHSNDPTALMAPIYKFYPLHFDLPDDDTRAVQALYGRKDEDYDFYYPEYTDTPTTTTTTRRTTTTPRYRPPVTHYNPNTRPPRRTTRRRTVPTTTTPRYRPPVTRYPFTRPPRRTTRRRITTTTTAPPKSTHCNPKSTGLDNPDLCATTIDAVTIFRGELFFFKGKYFWRMRAGKKLGGKRLFVDEIRPRFFSELFPHLSDLDHIDAVTNCPDFNTLIFFSGLKYYIITFSGGERMESGYLTDLGVNATKIDAAMIWGHNGKLYLFSGSLYWKLRPDYKSESDYPRDISVWRGVPQSPSAAMSIREKNYFFSGHLFWNFNNMKMAVENPPRLAGPFWLGCPFHKISERKLCLPNSSCKTDVNNIYIFVLLCFYGLFIM